MSEARIYDNIQDLNIALKLITRVRCNSRAGGIHGPKYSFATDEQRKSLDKASKIIVEITKELKELYYNE